MKLIGYKIETIDPSNEESGLGSLSESDIEALNESTHPNKGVVKLPLFAI